MTMPVVPYGGGYGGNGLFGGDGLFWLLVLCLFNNGWGFGGMGVNGMMPFMMGNQQGSEVQRGFDQSAIMNGLAGLQNGLASAEISRCNAQANTLAAMNAGFAGVNAGMNSLAMGLQNCCCENRASVADLKYTVATENCADRTALREVGTDILMNGNNNTQRLIDAVNNKVDGVMNKICQLELDAKNAQITELQAALNEANRRASQNEQTAQILAGQRTLANEVEQYVLPTPRPAYIVQNPNCCSQNNFGYGCNG